MGELSVCYEALAALTDSERRRSSGQFFTPDDAAGFMAQHLNLFPESDWLDPCCGVGNLAWHLANTHSSPSEFVAEKLFLNDVDPVAVKTAITLIASDFLGPKDETGFKKLRQRSSALNFLEPGFKIKADFIIINPPYAFTEENTNFETAKTKELFSYFLEKVTKGARGFISVTPASYINAPKFARLREVLLANKRGGSIYVFDNVPDTLFRGYKYGSSNTSKTNFVRASITVCSPEMVEWKITPILRWKSKSRKTMFKSCDRYLAPLNFGPQGEWVKMSRELLPVWSKLTSAPDNVGSLISRTVTEYSLTVATTPRYYISAAFRDLERRSKVTLYFDNKRDQLRTAAVLNSSVPYFWWRALDGGVTLPKRILLSTPIPEFEADLDMVEETLRASEKDSLVTKLNAGKINENIKHSSRTTHLMNEIVLPGIKFDFSEIYSENMFKEDEI